MLIYGSDIELAIGQVHTPDDGLTDAWCNQLEPQPVYILRSATAGEYIRCGIENGANPAKMRIAAREIKFFYEITTD